MIWLWSYLKDYIKKKERKVNIWMVEDMSIGERRGRECKNGGEEEYEKEDGGNGRW